MTENANRTGFLCDPRYFDHDTGPSHPENAGRLRAVLARLEKKQWFGSLKKIKPYRAPLEWIETCHSAGYVDRARKSCEGGLAILDTPDVAICPASYETALLAAGGALSLADEILAGRLENGFALLRPPGHHAEREFAMGFCLFNNIAILARYLQKKHGLERILILDWDVHHGNGTQHLFESDPTVFYISLHQYPFYPGTGASAETGTGKGKGATLNCPMKAGSGDAEYLEAFESKIIPAAEKFAPEAVLISAGFDAHALDPLAGINLTSDAYAWMTERVLEWASRSARGRVLSLLEGGYHLGALAECVEKHVAALSGNKIEKN